MRSYLTDIPPIFLIMRSFKTSKVELFQLDPTPGFRLVTPMKVQLNVYPYFLLSLNNCIPSFSTKNYLSKLSRLSIRQSVMTYFVFKNTWA